MTIGLDTSVVVRLLTGEPADLADVALRYFTKCQEEGHRMLVSDWVLAEVYYALQHHYMISKRETLRSIRDFLATPGVEGSGDAVKVITIPDLESAKPGFIDRVIYANYLRSGAEEMATFEKAAAKLSAVHILAV